MNIKFITAEETRDLRNKILRPGQPRSSVHYDCDNFKNVFHLGCFKDNKIVAVATFFPETLDTLSFKEKALPSPHYRLRGMATDPNYQGKGLGRETLAFAYEHLKSLGVKVLWCNARTSAINYYVKIGFQTMGEEFDIPGIGGHYVAFIKL